MAEILTKRIYRITAPNMDKHYYGSTGKSLTARMHGHRGCNNTLARGHRQFICTSFELLADPDVFIEEVELVTGTKAEIAARERHWITNNPCVNKRQPGRTNAESRIARWRAADRIRCGCGGKYLSIAGSFNRHSESRKHCDWVHARQMDEIRKASK